jgi:transposase
MVKVPWWTCAGLCLPAQRLERGPFVWLPATNSTVMLTQAQLSTGVGRSRQAQGPN